MREVKTSTDNIELIQDSTDSSSPFPSGVSKKSCKKISLGVIILLILTAALVCFLLVGQNPQGTSVPLSPKRISTTPDPVLELYPDWLYTAPDQVNEDYYRFWASSPFKNESIAVKNKYLNKILATEYPNPYDKLIIFITMASFEVQRRMLIRVHQINLYRDYNISFKFVIGSPPPAYRQTVVFENKTYGDMIFLENVPDTRDMSRTIKIFELFKLIEDNYPVYKYIGKMDGDCFLNIPGFLQEFFTEEIQNYELALIAGMVRGLGKYDWAQGGLEIYSYKLMLIINRLYESVHRTVYEEDFQIGWYLGDAEVNYTVVEIPDNRAFDFRGHHNIFNDTIRPHDLKIESDYLNVASCFNKDGVNYTQVEKMRESNWT